MNYQVNAEWDDSGWWVVTVPGVPGAITQARRLDQVPADAAEVIEIQTGHPVDIASLTINASLSGEAGDVAAEARSLREQAHRLTEQAGERTRTAVALLSQKGFTVRDIGALTGITYQRAQQLRKG